MNKYATLCVIATISIIGLLGCATSSSTRPGEISSAHATCLMLGLCEDPKGELRELRKKTEELQNKLDKLRRKLVYSKSRLEVLEKKLSETRHKTKSARDKARKIKAELRLKKQDLKNKSRELANLEQQIKALKINQSSGNKSLERLTQVEMELSSTKKEIAVLTNYLKDDLFIRAENSLKYD